MTRLPLFGVIFFLACGSLEAGNEGFSPFSTEIALPESAAGKQIWFATRLGDGRLGIGYNGGVVVGVPGGSWQHWSTPDGLPVRTLAEGHGQIVVGGAGFVGRLAKDELHLFDREVDREVTVVSTEEGWLVGTEAGLRLYGINGDRIALPEATNSLAAVRVLSVDDQVWVTAKGHSPRIWINSKRDLGSVVGGLPKGPIYMADPPTFMAENGLIDGRPSVRIPDPTKSRLHEEGVVGFARKAHHLYVGTFRGGIYQLSPAEWEAPEIWPLDRDLYWLRGSPIGLLAGTSDGLRSIVDPDVFLFKQLDGIEITSLAFDNHQNLEVRHFGGTVIIDGEGNETRNTKWTERNNTELRGKALRFDNHVVELPNNLADGLSSQPGGALAVHFGGATLLKQDGSSAHVRTASHPTSVASEGGRFFIGTEQDGILIVDTDGAVTGRIGRGRAAAIQQRPDSVALVFWDGQILTGSGQRIADITSGNPLQVTRLGNDFAVLVLSPSQEPVIGIVQAGRWVPLEVPGLAQIGATHMIANQDFLFVAGRRGLIRATLPLQRSAAPTPTLRWSAPVVGHQVELSSEKIDRVQVTASPLDLPPAPTTRLRFRISDSDWQEMRSGSPFDFTVPWGATSVQIEAERNGLSTVQTFSVHRPYPWWLRTWAWPIHLSILFGVILAGIRLRTNQLQRRNRELENYVAERTAALRKANAAKEEFLAGISHEIRNPLNGVVGICAMLADRDVGPREKMLVRTLGGCADQLRSMLDDILDFGRIERGDVQLVNLDFELRSLLEESARVMDPELTRCTLILPDEDIWLHGDSGKLRQVICNLVSNALKYGDPAEAGIEARAERTDTGRARLRIAVRNTGPTIPADELPRLFESFRRGRLNEGQPGSGLGLAVCRRLVQAMGGRILAASENNVTEFSIELVLPAALPPATDASPEVREISHALAIEDEDYNRIALGHILRGLGYSVDWAADAATAIKLAGNRPYDLILTDWKLPDMSGDELCRVLLSLQPEPLPPVIAVTAYSADEKLQAAIAAGMAGYVVKPVTSEKLRDVIRRLSGGLRPRRSLDTRLLAAAPRSSAPRAQLASLGSLAPSAEELAEKICDNWQAFTALAEMKDPRAANSVHALRSLLLLAGEQTAAEQAGLLENALDQSDHKTVAQLLPFAAEEISAACDRLRAE